MTQTAVFLTTVDNPYDPVDQYDEWQTFDKRYNYDCEQVLARFANLSDQLSESENQMELEDAIDSIVACDPLNVYTKLKKKIEVEN